MEQVTKVSLLGLIRGHGSLENAMRILKLTRATVQKARQDDKDFDRQVREAMDQAKSPQDDEEEPKPPEPQDVGGEEPKAQPLAALPVYGLYHPPIEELMPHRERSPQPVVLGEHDRAVVANPDDCAICATDPELTPLHHPLAAMAPSQAMTLDEMDEHQQAKDLADWMHTPDEVGTPAAVPRRATIPDDLPEPLRKWVARIQRDPVYASNLRIGLTLLEREQHGPLAEAVTWAEGLGQH